MQGKEKLCIFFQKKISLSLEHMRKLLGCCFSDEDPADEQCFKQCYLCQYPKPDSRSRCECAWLPLCDDCLGKACNPCLHCGTCVIPDEKIARALEENECMARALREMAMNDDENGGNNLENLRRMPFESLLMTAVHYDRDDLYEMLRRQGLTNISDFLDNKLEDLPMCDNMGLQKAFLKEFRSFLPAKRKYEDTVSLNCWVVTKRRNPVRCVLRVGHTSE